ncbi:hypothetical protein [Bosea sp. NBC_00550]|uniref:hypothetical protein n=1 Tax=Bosea sp. NBC_00550 TaxID=2969621 RepID=UPI0022326F96|nr:hypothetical protein [Bosea sp. NBC_00550]UZF95611.1 hypothetical protein NWE53_29575 [Bosea sp. NBC_00550]
MLMNSHDYHISLGTNVLASRELYDAVLECVCFLSLTENAYPTDFGVSSLLVSLETGANGERASAGNSVHIAFGSGWPKVGCSLFVLDPGGNKIEAVTRHGK